jgi:hypothetical protein
MRAPYTPAPHSAGGLLLLATHAIISLYVTMGLHIFTGHLANKGPSPPLETTRMNELPHHAQHPTHCHATPVAIAAAAVHHFCTSSAVQPAI